MLVKSALEDEVHKLKSQLHAQEIRLEKYVEDIFSLTSRLAESKKENAELYDFSSSIYFTIDKHLIIQSLNFQAAQLLGFDRKLLINKQFSKFLTFKFKNIFQHNINMLFEKKVKQIFEIEILQKGGVRKYVIMEGTLHRKKFIRLCLIDVTNTRQLEMQAFETEKSFYLLNTLFQNAGIAVATFDTNLNIKVVNNLFNEWFTTVFSRDIQIGMNLSVMFADCPELRTKLTNASHEAIAGNKVSVLFENHNKNKEYFCYQIVMNAYYNEYPQQIELAFRIRDITESKLEERRQHKLQAEIAIASRTSAMGEMASAFAHEINQPLTAIIAYSRGCLFTIQNRLDDKTICSKLSSPLEHIANQAEHAGKIIHSMKNFMRNGHFFVEETDINMLIKESLTILNYELLDIKLKITLNFMDYLPKVMLNKIHIIQIILNLARNSIEALQSISEPEPELIIETRMLKDHIAVHVIDNGPGIPAELQDKILTTYFTTKSQGTGIGLGVCRSLIEAHGGELSLQKHPKKGAWFTFTLPKNLINDDSYEIK